MEPKTKNTRFNMRFIDDERERLDFIVQHCKQTNASDAIRMLINEKYDALRDIGVTDTPPALGSPSAIAG